jgi:heme exporter protein C
MSGLRLGVLGVAIAVMMVYNIMAPDAAFFRDPGNARTIFTHLPCALICSILVIVAAWFGVKVLKNGDDASAAKLHAALELGTIYAALTMATGIFFSGFQWGSFWHNDPRQVSFLIALFLYSSALMVRSAYPDPVRRDRATAAMALILLMPAVFLIYVYPRLPGVKQNSMHPSETIAQGGLDVAYSVGVWGSFLIMGWLAIELFRLRVLAECDARHLEHHGSDQTHRRPSSSDGMVRPVAVSPED